MVLVEIKGDARALSGLILHACLSWSGEQGASSFVVAPIERRSSDRQDVINIGIAVPDLDLAKGNWPRRIWSGDQSLAGLGIVPLARLRIVGGIERAIVLDEVRDVGVTSLWMATILTFGAVILALGLLHELARRRGVLRHAPNGRRRIPGQTLFLRLIIASNGKASLSQLQILLWTFVVGAGAVYVMSLSGNLINVTSGTLALLGIAGASSLLAETKRTPGPPGHPVQTGWSDLIAPEDGSPGTDVKRVQMLFFTLISAVFVSMKVLTTYLIPEVPEGYLLLMGISNGVYIGGKFT